MRATPLIHPRAIAAARAFIRAAERDWADLRSNDPVEPGAVLRLAVRDIAAGQTPSTMATRIRLTAGGWGIRTLRLPHSYLHPTAQIDLDSQPARRMRPRP